MTFEANQASIYVSLNFLITDKGEEISPGIRKGRAFRKAVRINLI